MLAALVELSKEDIIELLSGLYAMRNELYDNLIFDKAKHERVDKLIDTFSKLIEIINQGEKNEKAGLNNVVKMAKIKVSI
jgi:hypothetical protein